MDGRLSDKNSAGAEIRGFDKFPSDNDDPDRLSLASAVPVRGLEKFPDAIQTGGEPRTELQAQPSEMTSIDLRDLDAFDSLEVETSNGVYVLEFCHHGVCQVRQADGVFVGDSTDMLVSLSQPLRLVAGGKVLTQGTIRRLQRPEATST